MLKYYRMDVYTVYKGESKGCYDTFIICDEKNANPFKEVITWENLDEIYKKFGSLCKFSVWNTKKGRRISFLNTWVWQEPEEWKIKALDLELLCGYTEVNASINDILNYHDSNLAIQYLKERGLNCCCLL